MPREYTPYAIFETTFLLSDNRYLSLPASSKVVYIALWARCFQDRRDTLPIFYDTSALHRDTGIDHRTLRNCVTLLQQKCLIEILADGRIKVCGIKGKGTIRWKDDGVNDSQKSGKERGQGHGEEKKRREEKRTTLAESHKNGSPLVASLQTNTGDGYPVTDEMVSKFKSLYPAVNIIQELRNMEGWLLSNPMNRKTSRGMLRFINSWLSRNQNKAAPVSPVSKRQHPPAQPLPTGDLSGTAELYDDENGVPRGRTIEKKEVVVNDPF